MLPRHWRKLIVLLLAILLGFFVIYYLEQQLPSQQVNFEELKA